MLKADYCWKSEIVPRDRPGDKRFIKLRNRYAVRPLRGMRNLNSETSGGRRQGSLPDTAALPARAALSPSAVTECIAQAKALRKLLRAQLTAKRPRLLKP
jgi:hypothetical protein